ncbi:MAG: hypothetical protein ACK5MY_02540 [Jhaorihella sp.]
MAVVFADPFGSFIEGAERGQAFELDYQQQALNSYISEMKLLDQLVLAPQREIAAEQRQYARDLDLLAQRYQYQSQLQAEGQLAMTPLFGSSAGSVYDAESPQAAPSIFVNPERVTPMLGGTLSRPGAASVGNPASSTRFQGIPQ